VLLDNSGAADALTGQVRALWDGRLVPFAANISTRTAVGYRPVLVPADPAWPGQARRLIARLQLVCGAAARRIDHVGSTSVAGLDAKDVIDIQVTVPDTGVAESLVRPLAEAGFPRRSTAGAQRSGSTIDPAFVATHVHSGADPGRPVNIHLRTEGSPAQRFALLFRDWLAASPAVRAEYLTVKRRAESAAGLRTGDELAARHAYNLVKEPWFATAVERAAEWARETGWTP
jgi:dephospho-CoA kinase